MAWGGRAPRHARRPPRAAAALLESAALLDAASARSAQAPGHRRSAGPLRRRPTRWPPATNAFFISLATRFERFNTTPGRSCRRHVPRMMAATGQMNAAKRHFVDGRACHIGRAGNAYSLLAMMRFIF